VIKSVEADIVTYSEHAGLLCWMMDVTQRGHIRAALDITYGAGANEFETPKYNCEAPCLIFKRKQVGYGEGISPFPFREGSEEGELL